MTGLVYKEWKQDRWLILSMLLCGSAPVLVLLLMHSEITDIGDAPIRIGGLLAGAFAAGALQMAVLRGDDRKLWAYWITASADGYRGYLRVKYEMIFGMIVLFLFSVQLVDMGYCAVAADRGQDAVPISGIALLLGFVQILLRSIDIPFVYHFGRKKGSIIKMIYMVTAAILLVASLILDPARLERIIETCRTTVNAQNGSLLLSVGLIVCLVMYCLSYRISCRLYLKGVEQYDH